LCGWLLIRTRILGREDLPVVHEIQNAMKIYPLSAYGKAYTPPRGVYTKEKDFVALKRIGTMDVQEFFDRFNRLAVDNPASPQDAPALEKFSALGIGPGQKFRLSALSVPAQEKARRTLPGMIDTDYSNKNAKIEEYNHWMFMDPTVGCFGTDYKFRAVVAYGGFANPVKMAIYPSMVMDGEFHLLDGKSRYRLHFGKDRLPPHHEGGWWSLTGYDAAGHLIDNELDRYHLDDKSDFVFEEDGSLVLSIQSTQPDEKVSNWLPVCEDIFSLTLRIYLPADAALEHTWIPPCSCSGRSESRSPKQGTSHYPILDNRFQHTAILLLQPVFVFLPAMAWQELPRPSLWKSLLPRLKNQAPLRSFSLQDA